MPEWTKEQQQAIDSRNGTILVSAAAGSGKTSVLVERVIKRLEDEKNPCSVDKLLIVTFTRAATKHMRDEIGKAIEKSLAQNPADTHLLHQQIMLPYAKICTIDSFCNDVIKENFYSLNISPDYSLIDEAEQKLMMNDAAEETLEYFYKENSPEFSYIAKLMNKGGNDSALISLIIDLYKYSRAFPYPDEWLDKLLCSYNAEIPAEKSIWGKIIIANLNDKLNYLNTCIDSAVEIMKENDSVIYERYGEVFLYYKQYVEYVLKISSQGKWDEIIAAINCFAPDRVKSLPRGYCSEYVPVIKSYKTEITETVKHLSLPFCSSQKEYQEDIQRLYPVTKKLVQCIKKYEVVYSAIKAKKNLLDFSDTIHYAVNLLVAGIDKNGNPIKTETAKRISEDFDEILIDEFQDINETQSLLFKAVSKNESNLFMVGDVKQSIYRFRQAMPEIFINKRNSYEYYNGENYPAKITLGKNFRSRSGVTECVNFIFSQLMSKELGDIDYNEDESLIAAAAYDEKNEPDAQIHIIENNSELSLKDNEAEYIAKLIKDIMNSGMTVKDKTGQRPVRFKDICILMRSPKNSAQSMAEVLSENSIPAYVSERSGFFDATEINTVLSLMRVIDNPNQDIPLLTVLLSPIFGFSADDVSLMKIGRKNESLYSCVVASAKAGSVMSNDFLNKMSHYRVLGETLQSEAFVRELLNSTGYSALAGAMDNPSQRLANLNLLLDYASKYEAMGYSGLSGFIRFIDRVERNNGEIKTANELSQNADVVKIMSIHKSKGLEFPVCILANCSARFNLRSLNNNIIFNPDCGLGFNIKEEDTLKKYPSIGAEAVKIAEHKAELSEEMRVLYVALTRAKEKLYCVVSVTDIEKSIEKMSLSLSENVKINSYKVEKCLSMGEWIIMCALRHPMFYEAAKKFYSKIPAALQEKSKIDFKFYQCEDEDKPCELGNADNAVMPEPSPELIKNVKSRIEYKYPYEMLTGLAAKRSPSDSVVGKSNSEYFASSKPCFLNSAGMTGAQKGTAVHKFLEFYDYTAKDDEKAAKFQAEKMRKNHMLTDNEADSLDLIKIDTFLKSSIAKRISQSSCIMREKKVTIGVKASEIYDFLPPYADGEEIIIQGYVDCAFVEDGEIVILDYKTDRINDLGELAEKYTSQMLMYKKALEECVGLKVKEMVFWSMFLEKSIKI